MSPEVIGLTERSTEPVARARAARIRQGIHNYLETLSEIALAYERRDWAVLGYADWQAYVDGEFGAERLKLPAEHRHKAVAELRLAGMSQRAIGTALGVDQATVQRDLARGDADASPAEITGADGKTYAATKPRQPAKSKDMSVWVAAARKGIEAHELRSADVTVCGRSTRTGLTMLLSQAEARYEVVRCMRCSPLNITRVAPGDPAHARPAAETHDPRASREAGAEIRGSVPAGTTPETGAGVACTEPADGVGTAFLSAGDVAPAPAPPPATSPAAGGAEVTLAEGLTAEQVRRLRAVFKWARASRARHPRNAAGRGKPATLGMEYAPGEPTPPVHPKVAHRGQLAHVEVCWEEGQVDVVFRSDRYELDRVDMWPVDVEQAIDLLCAFGVLPAWFSRQYAEGILAGLRGGDAIDGQIVEVLRG